MSNSKGKVATTLLAILCAFALVSSVLYSRTLSQVTSSVTTTTSSKAAVVVGGSGSSYSCIHVLYGLSGDDPGFLSEFEVSLKSVLLNAPHSAALHVHVMADQTAHDALRQILDRTNVTEWTTRQPITIETYNVEPQLPEYSAVISDTLSHWGGVAAATRLHTIGCFFRLFADRVVDKSVTHILYLDTDAVVMANLQGLWRLIDPDAWFHWGKHLCSGFILLRVDKLKDIWAAAKKADLPAIQKEFKQDPNDQLIFRSVNVTRPEVVSMLPDGWDASVTNFWRERDRLGSTKPNIGMLHFNGGGASKESVFHQNTSWVNIPDYENSWGLARYYARMPWTWSKYHMECFIGDNEPGYPLTLIHDDGNNDNDNDSDNNVTISSDTTNVTAIGSDTNSTSTADDS